MTAILDLPHPEEPPQAASRRTHGGRAGTRRNGLMPLYFFLSISSKTSFAVRKASTAAGTPQ